MPGANVTNGLTSVSYPVDGVALIKLTREEKRNALSNQLIGRLAGDLKEIETSAKARCIVITGSSDVFSAGADIVEMRERGIAAIANESRMAAWKSLESSSIPLIAAVSGICFGGGHELAMLCDVVIASSNARFGQPEIKLGHIPGDGATQRLARIVGKYQAMKMILTGEPIDATEALRIGLVCEIADPAVDRALELAAQIARHSPVALALAKDAVLAANETFLDAGLRRERENISKTFTTEDQKEGMAAFFEKRPPRFIGR